MTRKNIVVLRKVFPQHVGRLDACDRMLSQGKYNEAVITVRTILKEEYNKAQEYARAGKLAQDSSIIQSVRELKLRFEDVEGADAGRRIGMKFLKEYSGKAVRGKLADSAVKGINRLLNLIAIDVEIPEELGKIVVTVFSWNSKIIRDKNYRNELIDDLKIWLWNVKNKVCGWWRSLKAGARGFIGLSDNRAKLRTGG